MYVYFIFILSELSDFMSQTIFRWYRAGQDMENNIGHNRAGHIHRPLTIFQRSRVLKVGLNKIVLTKSILNTYIWTWQSKVLGHAGLDPASGKPTF
jgi:hypothetical protein